MTDLRPLDRPLFRFRVFILSKKFSFRSFYHFSLRKPENPKIIDLGIAGSFFVIHGSWKGRTSVYDLEGPVLNDSLTSVTVVLVGRCTVGTFLDDFRLSS